jgi:hypothetical protein
MFAPKMCLNNHEFKSSFSLAIIWGMISLTMVAVGCQTKPADISTSPARTATVLSVPAVATEFPPGFPTPHPDTYAACLKDGGRWEVLGFSGPGCNLPTTDGGQPCKDSRECESACLADPNEVKVEDEFGQLIPDAERLVELNALEGDRVGACSPWRDNFGCQVWVERGRFVEICVD